MADQKAPTIANDSTEKVLPGDSLDPTKMSLETLILLINCDRLKILRDKTNKEFSELKARQDKVSTLHKLLKKINVATSDKGELDFTSNAEISDLLKQAKELGIEYQEGKTKYSKDERDRFVDNIQMTIDDFNVHNEMQLQTINRLTNERHECYQLARSILKPLHEAKMQTARAIKQ